LSPGIVISLQAKCAGGGRQKSKSQFKYLVAFFNIRLDDAESIYAACQVYHFIIQVKQAQTSAILHFFSLSYSNQAVVKFNLSGKFTRAAVKPGIDMPQNESIVAIVMVFDAIFMLTRGILIQ
jgi:hypothetical protein